MKACPHPPESPAAPRLGAEPDQEVGALRGMAVEQLLRACREETAKFLRHEPSHDRYCYELFRRAFCERDQAAWAAVYGAYQPIVAAWFRIHPLASAARDVDDLVNRAFERFWRALGPERFSAFPSLATLLRYLKACVNSIVQDDLRALAAAKLEPLDDATDERLPAPDAAAQTESALSAQELWRIVSAEVQDEAERLVAHLCFVLEYRPREVQARCPAQFPTVADVYRVKRNLQDRLRRSPALRDFLN